MSIHPHIITYDKQDLIFPIEEFQSRLDNVRRVIAEKGADAFVITTPENIFYLTGYQTLGYWYFQALVIPADKPPFMVLRELENVNVEGRTYLNYSFTYQDNDEPIKAFHEAMCENGLEGKRIGVELHSYFLRHTEFTEMRRFLPDSEFFDMSGTVEEFRKVKSPLEIKKIRKAGNFTRMGMETALKKVRVGSTENELAADFLYGELIAGSHYTAMPPFIASGPRSYLAHATFMNRTLEPDEFVLVEGTGAFERYHAPCMRTVYMGKPVTWVQDIESVLQDALRKTIDAMRPGVTAAEVDAVNQSIITNNTFGGEQTSRTGYSVGIAFAPDWGEGHMISLMPENDEVLQENMTFHVLSYIQIPGSEHCTESRFGLTDSVRVTKKGGRSLIGLPYEFKYVY